MADTQKDKSGPTGSEADLAARIAVLEERLAEFESRDEADPMGRLLEGLIPAEVRQHMRAARREQLLAARSFLDHWIDRLDRKPAAREPRRRESITLE
jgi:hypothetical protein